MKKIYSFLLLGVLTILLVACTEEQAKTTETAAPTEASEATINYPEQSIQVVIPFAAGGVTDSLARIIIEGAQKNLPNGSTIVPVNVAGAGGAIGMSQLLDAKTDGYTIAFSNTDAISVQNVLTDTAYKTDSFESIIKLASAPFVLATKSDSQWKTFEDLVTYTKENPGAFKYGSPFVGSPSQIGMEYLKNQDGIETTHVPYDGAALLPALLGNNIDAYTGTPASLAAYKDTGEVNVLVNFGDAKIAGYEDVPTFKELGYDFGLSVSFGLVGPKGMDVAATQVIHDAFQKALEDEAVIAKIEGLSVAPTYGTAEDFQNDLTNVKTIYDNVLKTVQLK